MQPLLFGLMGTDIKFDYIDKMLILQGCGVLFFGLVVSSKAGRRYDENLGVRALLVTASFLQNFLKLVIVS